jgi:hypothetical protein
MYWSFDRLCNLRPSLNNIMCYTITLHEYCYEWWRGFARERKWLIWNYSLKIGLERLRKTKRKLRQHNSNPTGIHNWVSSRCNYGAAPYTNLLNYVTECLHVSFWNDGFSIACVNAAPVLHQLLPTVSLNAVTICMAFHRLERWVISQCAVYGKQIYNLLDCELYIGKGGNWVTWEWYSPRRTKLILFMFCQYVSSIIPLTVIEIHFVNSLQSSNHAMCWFTALIGQVNKVDTHN